MATVADTSARSQSPNTNLAQREDSLNAAFESRPKQPKFQRRPYCFGSPELRSAHFREMSRVIAAYEDASERYRAGDRRVRFPEGTYPPPVLQIAMAA